MKARPINPVLSNAKLPGSGVSSMVPERAVAIQFGFFDVPRFKKPTIDVSCGSFSAMLNRSGPSELFAQDA